MNRFVINLIYFSLYLICIFLTIEFLCKKVAITKDRVAWQYQELFKPKVKADIVVLGTSKSIQGINPKQLEDKGITVYNFGLNGSNPEFIFSWYNKYFKKYYKKPKLILFEVSWLMFNEDWMFRRIEHDTRYFPLKEYCFEFVQTGNKSTAFFCRYHIFNRIVKDGSILDSTYHGYTPHPYEAKVIESLSDSICFNPNRQRYYFDLLLNSFKNDSVNVMFVMLPEKIDSAFLKYKYISKNINYIEQRLNDYDFLNYHQEFKVDSVFQDWGHLNIIGARLISQKIDKDLKALNHNIVFR